MKTIEKTDAKEWRKIQIVQFFLRREEKYQPSKYCTRPVLFASRTPRREYLKGICWWGGRPLEVFGIGIKTQSGGLEP